LSKIVSKSFSKKSTNKSPRFFGKICGVFLLASLLRNATKCHLKKEFKGNNQNKRRGWVFFGLGSAHVRGRLFFQRPARR
jgi:hypothetical protein